MKLSTTAVTLAGLLCGPASLAAATSCEPGKQYKGEDLLSMNPAYESLMISQLEYWSKNGNANGMVPSKANIEKSFFKCEGEMQLNLMHWCACGIADTVDATTGMKDGEVCVMTCSAASSGMGSSSTPVYSTVSVAVPVVVVAAFLFAAGML